MRGKFDGVFARFCLAERARWEIFAAAIAVAVATTIVAGGSFFLRDDLVFAEYFQLNPLTVDAFFRSWFGHLVPGYIATVTSFLSVFGLSWPAALAFTALINMGASVALTRILDALLGPVRFNVIAGLAFSLSLGPLASRMWWAATLTNMFPLALGLAVLGCATRWVIRRRARYLVAALVLYAIGLAMSEKNLLFSLHIAMWCVLVVWRGQPLSMRIREVGRTWALWLGLAVLSIIDVVVFLTGGYISESGTSPGLRTSAAFIVDSIIGGLIPSLFGVDMSEETGSLVDPRVVVTVILFSGFVLWTTSRVRSNWGVWVFAIIGVLANVVAVSRRADLIGITGGRNLRYLLESSAIVWLVIGVVLVTTLRATSTRSRASRMLSAAPLRFLGTVCLVVIFTFSVWSWSTALAKDVSRNEGRAAREWVGSLEATLPRTTTPPLIDSPLPTTFGLPPLHPYDMVGALLPSLGWHEIRTTNSLDGAWVVGPDGVAGPASLANSSVPFTGTRCTDGTTSVSVPEVHSPGRKYLVVDFSQATGNSVAFVLTGGWTTIEHPSGSGKVVVYFAAPITGDLQISSQGGDICIDSVAVGDILPQNSSNRSR